MHRAAVFLVAVMFVTACTAGNSASPTAGGSGGGGAWDPKSISGTVILSGWQSSPAEGNALTQTLLAFQAA